MSNSIKVYLAHPIRGIKGKDATIEDMQQNCNKTIIFVKFLREMFSELDIYCPAEHDDFIQIAYSNGILTENEILTVDCILLSRRDLLLVDVRDCLVSKGMNIEIEYAQKHSIPILFLFNMEQTFHVISDFLEAKKR